MAFGWTANVRYAVFQLLKPAVFVGTFTMAGLLIFFLCATKIYTRELRIRLIVLEIYCVALAFLSPNLLLYNLAAGLIVPLFATQRNLIAPVFIFALLGQPGPGMTLQIGGIYLISLTPTVALTIGAIMTAMVRGGGTSRGWSGPGTCLVIIFFVLLWPGVRATTVTNLLRALVELSLSLVAPFYIIRRTVRDLDDVRLAMVGLMAATAALATLAIFEAWSGWPLYRIIYSRYGIELGSGASVKLRGGLLRAPGPYTEPLSLSYQLCIGALLALTNKWMFRSRATSYAMMGLMVAGMFAPQSRGAWLGLGCGMIAYAIYTGKARTLVKMAVVVPALGILTYIAGFSVPYIGNMLGMNAVGVIGKDYRQTLLERGWEEAQKHLLFGQKIDAVFYALRDMVQGEGIVDLVNQYLAVLLFSGLVGLIPFVAAMAFPSLILWRARANVRDRGILEIAFVGGALGSIIVMLSVMPLMGRSSMTLSILLAFAGVLSQLRPTDGRRATARKPGLLLGSAVRPKGQRPSDGPTGRPIPVGDAEAAL